MWWNKGDILRGESPARLEWYKKYVSGELGVAVPALDKSRSARLNGEEEAAVRSACSEALDALEVASGRTVGEIDAFFFGNGRRACTQVEDPSCGECALRSACAQDTGMFQPIFRTTAY